MRKTYFTGVTTITDTPEEALETIRQAFEALGDVEQIKITIGVIPKLTDRVREGKNPDDRLIKVAERNVLVFEAIPNTAPNEKVKFITIQELQEKTSLSETMVRKAIQALLQQGMIYVERKGKGGRIFLWRNTRNEEVITNDQEKHSRERNKDYSLYAEGFTHSHEV